MVDLSEAQQVVGAFLKEARDAGTVAQHCASSSLIAFGGLKIASFFIV
jgi:hypothetical protein